MSFNYTGWSDNGFRKIVYLFILICLLITHEFLRYRGVIWTNYQDQENNAIGIWIGNAITVVLGLVFLWFLIGLIRGKINKKN